MSTNGRLHWPEYLIEAGALGTFMISACVFGTLLGHPSSPVVAAVPSDFVRRMMMGVLMGLTLVAIVYSPWGRRSGAQMNPAFTLTFFRLGRSASRDAAGYVAAQFIGGALGVLVSRALLGDALASPGVEYVVTRPGMAGILIAFVAEALISALLLTVVLYVSSSERWKRYTGVFAGLLVATYITLEAPLSGMSMNPARTVASALGANDWMSVWLYFVAPLLGMLAAAELFVRRRERRAIPCGKLMHAEPCLFCDYVIGVRSEFHPFNALPHRISNGVRVLETRYNDSDTV
jgi:aquaporin Z